MNAKISEIFRSVQGEGKYIGVPQVFVRFFGCNMRCSWCDTPSSRGDETIGYEEFDMDEVLFHIMRLNAGCHSVSFTGGEPLLQANFLSKLLFELKQKNIKTYLDTNGICVHQLEKVVDDVDIIAMDIKMPSSTKCQDMWEVHREFLKIAYKKELFIKTVVTNDTKLEDINKTIELIEEIDKDMFLVLQPNTFEIKEGVVSKCYEYQNVCLGKLSNVRIMPQMHKFIGVK